MNAMKECDALAGRVKRVRTIKRGPTKPTLHLLILGVQRDKERARGVVPRSGHESEIVVALAYCQHGENGSLHRLTCEPVNFRPVQLIDRQYAMSGLKVSHRSAARKISGGLHACSLRDQRIDLINKRAKARVGSNEGGQDLENISNMNNGKNWGILYLPDDILPKVNDACLNLLLRCSRMVRDVAEHSSRLQQRAPVPLYGFAFQRGVNQIANAFDPTDNRLD